MADRIASPLKWHGGKGGFQGKLAKWIVGLMPPHLHYVEPYLGGANVLLAKDFEGISEVANDLQGDLMNFWRVLQSPHLFESLRRRLEATPFSQSEWKRALQLSVSGPVENAAAFFVRCRQSLAGRNDTFAPLSKSRTRRGMNEQASAWLAAIEGLPAVHARLKRVVVLNDNAIDVISREDSLQTCFYLDPPYLHETRRTTGEYLHEMTRIEHLDLLTALDCIKGKFLLSGYRSGMYDAAAKRNGWNRHEFNIVNNAAGGKTKREMTECVWTNY